MGSRTSCLFLLLVLLSACAKQSSVQSINEYASYLLDEKNGLEKTRYVNGIALKVKYMPPEFLAYLEAKNSEAYTQHQYDSLLQAYSNNITFRLSIGPDERSEKGGDIMLQGVTEYKEYAARSVAMNFEMAEFVSLKAGNNTYKPVLSAMENIYGMDSGRNILLVFTPENEEDRKAMTSGPLEFKYDDRLFELGTNYFVFNRNDINNIPAFPKNERAY